MEFGISPEELRYSVVVCPRCRKHAQIIESGKKTMSCQNCGARLQARKLRIFYSSDELEKAVAARTRLQAEISGKGKSPFTGNLSAGGASSTGNLSSAGSDSSSGNLSSAGSDSSSGDDSSSGSLSKENGASEFGQGAERKFPLKAAGKPSKPLREKKDPRKVILETLEAAGGKMETAKLREEALEKDLNPEKFEEILKKLQETGEVYSPSRGKIKIV